MRPSLIGSVASSRYIASDGKTISGDFSTNLACYFKCDTNGTFSDATGTVANGTINGVTYTSSGKINGAYTGDGVNDCVVFDEKLLSSNTFTINYWLKTSLTGNNMVTEPTIMEQRTSGVGADRLFNNSIDSNGYLTFSVHSGGAWATYATSTTDVTDNSWHMITCVRDSTTMYVYVDGTLEDSGAFSDTVNITNFKSSLFSRLLDNTLPGSYAAVTLDEVGFWNTDFSSTDVSDIYNSGNGIPYS